MQLPVHVAAPGGYARPKIRALGTDVLPTLLGACGAGGNHYTFIAEKSVYTVYGLAESSAV